MILDLGGGVTYISGAYSGSVWGGGVGIAEAPPAPAPVVYGGGYFPAITRPQAHRYVGVIFLGRLRVGSRVLFLENRAQAEDEEIIQLLELL